MDIVLEDNKDIELSAILRGDVNVHIMQINDPSSAPTPNPEPLPLNDYLTINPDIV